MKVETYEAISIDVGADGAVTNEVVDAEAMALIEQLGLKGQKELLTEREVGGETVTTRNPYRLITAEERAIFMAIMPRRTKLDAYGDGPVPLRVLQVAAHATELFDLLEVWHPAPGQSDPVLVGINGSAFMPRETFILARWGDELCSLDELRAKAIPVIRARMKAAVAKARAEVATFEAGLDEKIEDFLHGATQSSVFVTLSFERA